MAHDKADIERWAAEVWTGFVTEAGELLRRIEALLEGCAQADAAERAARWLELRRSLHTLKGAASAAGAERVKAATHKLEDHVGTAPPVVPEAFEALLDEVGQVHTLLEVDAVQPILAGTVEPSRELVIPVLEPAPRPMPAPAPAPAPAPVPSAARDKERSEPALPTAPAGSPAPPVPGHEGEYLRMRPERVDALHNLAGELVVARLQQTALCERLIELRAQAEEAHRLMRQLETQLHKVRPQIGPGRWDDLQPSVRASSTALTQIVREIGVLSRELPAIHEQAGVISSSLEDGIRELRLMPLQPFFKEYGKLVRETARACEKNATLSVRAEGAEIDRSVLTRLREPLLHLVRNAVVHGLETPAQRQALSKDVSGTVRLEARSEGTRVLIRVSDDGGGIDEAAVRARAVALRMLPVGQGERPLRDDELLDLLAHPGFSTRERVDGLAGRGIGLDVARAAVHGLGGRLSLDNMPGIGCIFTLDVPVTTSTSVGMVVRTGDENYAILLSQIDRVVRIGAEDMRSCEGRDVVQLGGQPVSAVPLAELLGRAARPGGGAGSGRQPAVLLSHGKQRMLLLVDDIPGEQAMVIKPFGRAFAGARLFLGGAVQADHAVLPVLQVPALFDRAAALRGGRLGARARAEPPRTPRSASVLVADDSLTIRTLLRNILSGTGYAVTVAHDGQSALEQLAQMPRCDLVITDLQMPRLDGSGLCRAIRASGRSQLPIIVVTSVGDPEEKRKALAAGADAYVIKAEFQQGAFLDLVARLALPAVPA